MTFGEKLKEARKTEGLSQEQFAEKMNVSRSAVAKWENDIGIPDVSNLKCMAKLLNVSIDCLLNEEKDISKKTCTGEGICIGETDTAEEDNIESCAGYEGNYYTIELTGWNDGVSDVIILGKDSMFIYYRNLNGKKSFYGMIGKKYISTIRKGKTIENITDNDIIDRAYFCNRHVKLEIAQKEGFFSGFFDMRNDDYLDVVIEEFDDNKIITTYGKEFDAAAITRIEEI